MSRGKRERERQKKVASVFFQERARASTGDGAPRSLARLPPRALCTQLAPKPGAPAEWSCQACWAFADGGRSGRTHTHERRARGRKERGGRGETAPLKRQLESRRLQARPDNPDATETAAAILYAAQAFGGGALDCLRRQRERDEGARREEKLSLALPPAKNALSKQKSRQKRRRLPRKSAAVE